MSVTYKKMHYPLYRYTIIRNNTEMSDIRTLTKTWAKKVGYQKAVSRLVSNAVSPRAAEKLCKGKYQSEPKSLRRSILEVLARDGFTLKDEAS